MLLDGTSNLPPAFVVQMDNATVEDGTRTTTTDLPMASRPQKVICNACHLLIALPSGIFVSVETNSSNSRGTQRKLPSRSSSLSKERQPGPASSSIRNERHSGPAKWTSSSADQSNSTSIPAFPLLAPVGFFKLIAQTPETTTLLSLRSRIHRKFL